MIWVTAHGNGQQCSYGLWGGALMDRCTTRKAAVLQVATVG